MWLLVPLALIVLVTVWYRRLHVADVIGSSVESHIERYPDKEADRG